MQKTGIKQLDEAQMLLFKEYKESGMNFLLIGFKEEKMFGAACAGSPLNIGAALAMQAHRDDRFETIIDIAKKGLEFIRKKEVKQMKKKDLSVSRCWLARDKDGDAALYRRKPTKYPEQGMWDDPTSTDLVFMPDNFLPLGINPKWEDEEPTEIEIRKPKE